MARQNFRIEWEAHQYEHKERSADWFWAVGIIVFSIAVASIIFGNIIFGILILIAAFTLSLFINRPPETTHVVIDEKGVTRGNVHYPYSTLHSFWIDEDHPHKKILLRSKKIFMPLIVVPLGEMDADRVHGALIKVLPEEFQKLPWAEEFLEFLGF